VSPVVFPEFEPEPESDPEASEIGLLDPTCGATVEVLAVLPAFLAVLLDFFL